jgi:RimJ/RimL family protein N-acetyltransferase
MGERGGEVKLLLREVVDGDLPVFFAQQLDPEANYMAAFTARDPADRDAFNAHWARIRANDENLIRTIVVDGQVAGSVASYVDPELGEPEVTYWIGREYWGRGIATRALSAFLKEQKARPIYGRAARDNIGSIRVLEKCGFQLTGYGKGFANARGEEIEEAILVLGA